MRLRQFINEGPSKYWKFPTESDMQSDFNEYKAKESYKWERRAKQNGFRFPIFRNFENYKETLKTGKVLNLTSSLFNKLPDSTNFSDIDELKSLVQSYHRPRDIDRIISGFDNNVKIPYPVILKGTKGYYRLSGNTRTNVAMIKKIPVMMLMVDVSDRR